MTEERTDRRFALIIASYEYQDPKLEQLVTPAQDAEALARVLKDPTIGNFDEVEVLINRPSHEVRIEVDSFFADRKLDDLLLLYFSGHGIKDDRGRLYLATTDTQRKLLRPTALPTTFVNDSMTDSRSRRQVLILDCCHGGAFARDMIPKGGESVDIDQRFKGRGRVVLTASTSTQYAFQGDEVVGGGSRSVFTRHLVQGLETGEADLDGDGWVSLDELYDYVHDHVTDETPQQTPGRWVFDMRGDIIIARNPRSVARRTKLPSELRQAIESPFAGLREGAVNELERLLHDDDEELALKAREALTQLADDDSRRVSAAAIAALGVAVEPAPVRTLPVEVKKPEPAPTLRREVPAEPAPDTLTITFPIHLELVRVPAGEFLMGSDPAKDQRAFDDEQPQHCVHVPEFYIAKTPLTNAQYAAFVKATKHEAPQHWRKDNVPSHKRNHPVVYVSWHDAIAFCEWLSRETSQDFRLPTEAEWEEAARGTDGRVYPWGDEFDKNKCNMYESGILGTTPVGKYSPAGDSPYGCVDMAGNVWEWVSSSYQSYPYQAEDGREDLEGGGRRVLRGGSFLDFQRLVRCASRNWNNPQARNDTYGLRVVVAAPLPSTSKP